MRNRVRFLVAGSVAALAFSAIAFAQDARPMPAAPQNAKPAAPAPRHDISGVWAGPVLPKREPVPEMTPWAQALFNARQPFGGGAKAVGVGASNDPMVMCDPLGFPRNMLYETRGFEFEQTPKKMLELLQYQRVWREVWTDGRKLPANAGGSELDAPDPRYYGYSVGRWDDDYTFVVETTGLDESSWLDEFGHPHSVNMHVVERYRRVDQDTLEVTINIDDPKAYVKPFEVMKQLFHWNPKQEFEEQLCVPSEAQEYLKTIAAPAAHK